MHPPASGAQSLSDLNMPVSSPAARRSVETPVSGLSATTHINRKDFGLIWNSALETGGIVVGEAVAISLDVEFVKTQG